jgi:hypothetical protein
MNIRGVSGYIEYFICEVFGCEHIVRLTIRVLGESATFLIPSSLLFSFKILLQNVSKGRFSFFLSFFSFFSSYHYYF